MTVDSTKEFSEIYRTLSGTSHVLIATHEHADGDALGSLLAMAMIVKPWAKVTLLAPDSKAENFSYLSGIEDIRTAAEDISLSNVDAIVLLDCGDVARTHLGEKIVTLGSQRPPVILLDHHPKKTTFANQEVVDLAVVDTTASSTAELVHRYCQANDIVISAEMATALLTGIITDTGGFVNLATTEKSMEVASELMKRGANLRTIVKATMRSKSVGMLQLWGRALSRLEHDPSSGIVTTALHQTDFEECGVDKSGTEGIANFLNSLGEGKMVIVYREESNGMVKASCRTKHPEIDVSAHARKFGGGGHKKAAGFTVPGKIVKKEYGWAVDIAQPSEIA